MILGVETDKTYFLTATILNWQHLLAEDSFKDILIKNWEHLVQKGDIIIYGFVIMPNHIHLLLRFKGTKKPFEIQRDMFKWISREMIARIKLKQPEQLKHFYVEAADRKYQIWERNSLAVEILNAEMFRQKLNYIHNNPIQHKWGLATHPEGYKYSSAGFYETGKCNWFFLTHYLD